MRRRDVLFLLGCTLLVRPFAAEAQALQKPRRIGVLLGWTRDEPQAGPFLDEFKRALGGLGWTEGRNLNIEWRWGGNDSQRIAAYARELVALAPELLVAHATPATGDRHRETTAIPLVCCRPSLTSRSIPPQPRLSGWCFHRPCLHAPTQ